MAAKKKTSLEQILATLQMGGETSGVSPLKVLLALATKPDVYSQVVSGARTSLAGSGLDQFDPEFDYDPSAYNPILSRYESMPERFVPLARHYFGSVRNAGGNEMLLTEEENRLLNDESWGLDISERQSLLDQMKKDKKAFLSAEDSVKKAQFKAFMSARKQAGIAGGADATRATNDYLEQVTGVRGLSADLPTSLDALAKRKTAEFKTKLLSQGRSEKTASEMAAQYLTQFTTKAKEKKVNPLLFGLKSVLGKNVLGG